MKTLLVGIVLTALAILLALMLQAASSATLVVLTPAWRFDMSLSFFAVGLLILLWTAYRGGRLLQRFFDFPERVRAYRERRSELAALRALRDALKAFMEGRFARAERAARRAQSEAPVAGLAALVGARAAHRMQEYERREEWLTLAESHPDLAVARMILSAEMWTEQRDTVRALKAISQLHGTGARHIHALRIALTANLHAKQWHDALRILRTLEKHRGLPEAAIKSYRTRAYRGLLRETAEGVAVLDQAWNAVPAAERLAPDLALDGARAYNRYGQGDQAARILEASLEQRSDPRLWDELARCENADLNPLLARLEQKAGTQPPSADAMRCLGRLCLKVRFWGKARSYLTESRRREPHPDTDLALAQLAEALDDHEAAATHYRDAALGLSRQVNLAAILQARELR